MSSPNLLNAAAWLCLFASAQACASDSNGGSDNDGLATSSDSAEMPAVPSSTASASSVANAPSQEPPTGDGGEPAVPSTTLSEAPTVTVSPGDGGSGGEGMTSTTDSGDAGGTAGDVTLSSGAAGSESVGGAGATGGSSGAGSMPPVVEPPCLTFTVSAAVAELAEPSLDQLSGMVASRSQAGVLYAHLDAGAAPEVFVFDAQGSNLGSLLLDGVETTDWEDIAASAALGEEPARLYVGDIGDNAARQGGTPRSELQIYRFAEPPAPSGGDVVMVSEWERVPVVYPDVAYDAETLMFDPLGLDLVLVTKANDGLSNVFRLPADASADAAFTLEQLVEVQIGEDGTQAAQASAGDISPSGDRILIRNYESALLWPRAAEQSIAEALSADPSVLETATEPQSEGITFAADGASWYSAGEQSLTLYQATADCE